MGPLLRQKIVSGNGGVGDQGRFEPPLFRKRSPLRCLFKDLQSLCIAAQ